MRPVGYWGLGLGLRRDASVSEPDKTLPRRGRRGMLSCWVRCGYERPCFQVPPTSLFPTSPARSGRSGYESVVPGPGPGDVTRGSFG